MKKVLVTGASGQLGKCIKDASLKFPDIKFDFKTKEELNIEDESLVKDYFSKSNVDYCINAAAYTNVEKAESEPEKALSINAEAIKNLAVCCKESDTILIQISTDYVFDGEKRTPYTEKDKTNPINVYGASKLKGEQYVQEICKAYFIFRTSWLYSQYGHNFYNSILKFAKEGRDLKITTEQTGTPTNANDLAKTVLKIISSGSKEYGIYNYSNTGEATWFDFAKEILSQTNQLSTTKLAKTDHYRTFAARPKYSVLDSTKIIETLNVNSITWKTSLELLGQDNYII
ncbi:MAG: dTDP-4-dehydrorhamnose reductase [Arcobacter sp.]|nr:dTDP-4-dehydrorhamnose reductase [Arcobacter sp.]